MPGIGIINNPHSRKNRQHPERMESFGYILGTQGESAATQEISDVHEMARLYKEREVDILGINGGDGSNHLTLTAFIQEYQDTPLPKVAFLRGGTMNTISNACGIQGTQAGLMLNLIHKYRNKIPFETIHRDTLKVAGRYGFIFGNGIVHNFLEAYYRSGKPSPWVAFKMLTRGFGSAVVGGSFARKLVQPFRAQVWVDGKKWEQESYTAMIGATIHQIGLGFKPFFRCEERPGSFHFLGFLKGPAGLIPSLPKLWLGRKVSPRKIRETVAEQVVFKSEQVWHYALDGDIHPADKSLELSLGPRLEIIVR